MAKLTSAFASSHGVMVTTELEDWLGHFSEFDRIVPLIDAEGRRCTYDELLARAPTDAAERIAPDIIRNRFAQMHQSLDRLRSEINASNLGALIVVGDDQNELFDPSIMPTFAVYCGPHIRNAQRSAERATDWVVRAKDRRQEPDRGHDYPVHASLAHHLIEGLQHRKFDLTVMHKLPEGKGESHAMSFVHRYLLQRTSIPIVPIFLNSFFPPNQPTPQRCLELGRAIAEVVSHFPTEDNIGVMASGGLSHFVLDEALDRSVVGALERNDTAALAKIPTYKLQSGSSEILNWICVAGAVDALKLSWIKYIPGYRTPALTGTGLCFARWQAA
jgi:3-O-methylgallate 3,4-dioxygenase